MRGGVTSPPRRAEAPLARNPASGPLNHHRAKRRRRGSGTKPQGKTSRTHTRRRQPEQPAPASTPLPTAEARGINGRRGLEPRTNPPTLTQCRSLRSLLRPPRCSCCPVKSRSRRARKKKTLQRPTKPLCAPNPPFASAFIPTLHAASLRHRGLICIHQRLFLLAGAFADALTSPTQRPCFGPAPGLVGI